MAFKNYNLVDRGTATLSADIVASDVIINIDNIEGLPTSNFTLTLAQEQDGSLVKSEKIYVTTRTGGVLTGVVRGYAGSSAKSFNDGDSAVQNIIAEHIIDIQVELTRQAGLFDGKANISHTHIISNITGLQTALNTKLEASDITGKANLSGDTFTGTIIQKRNTSSKIYAETTLATGSYTTAGYVFKTPTRTSELGLRGSTAIDTPNSIYLYHNGARRQVWLDNGNVGIGVDAPTEKIDIGGNIKTSGVLYTGFYEKAVVFGNTNNSVGRIANSNAYHTYDDHIFYRRGVEIMRTDDERGVKMKAEILHNLGGYVYGASFKKIGQINFNAGARCVKLEIMGGGGYNGGSEQNSLTQIVMKSGNSESEGIGISGIRFTWGSGVTGKILPVNVILKRVGTTGRIYDLIIEKGSGWCPAGSTYKIQHSEDYIQWTEDIMDNITNPGSASGIDVIYADIKDL